MVRLADYLQKLGVTLTGDAFIFRNRSGAPYSKDTLGDDFRDVRLALYGPDEKRTLADFRRSGSMEAVAGQAAPAALAHVMGNSLDRCHELFKVYCTINIISLRDVAAARERGAAKLKQEQKPLKSRNTPADEVGTAS
jgi:hypothetical protein